MTSMWTVSWWKDVGERAIRTAAQTAVSLLVVGDTALGLLAIDWGDVGSLAGGAALVSLLTSIATHTVTGNGPSFSDVHKGEEPTSDEPNHRAA